MVGVRGENNIKVNHCPIKNLFYSKLQKERKRSIFTKLNFLVFDAVLYLKSTHKCFRSNFHN